MQQNMGMLRSHQKHQRFSIATGIPMSRFLIQLISVVTVMGIAPRWPREQQGQFYVMPGTRLEYLQDFALFRENEILTHES